MICAWTSVLLWRTVPNFPCLTFGGHSIPASREFEVGDRSDQDCVVSQPVRSLRRDFQVWENRRHQKQDVAHERFGRDIGELIEAITVVRRSKRREHAVLLGPWSWIGAMAASVL